MATFEPEALVIERMFEKHSEYTIPMYQRPYSWQKEHVEQLWYDLIESYNNSMQSDDEDYIEDYFLGSVVLIKNPKAKNKPIYDVVDGQQRLTTLTILFCVLRDMDIGLPEHIIQRLKDCVTDTSKGIEKNRLILSQRENHQGYFSEKIQKKINFDNIFDKKENQFIENALVLKNLVETSIKEGNDYYIEDLGNFIEYILENVYIIKIVCENLSFAIRLFSVINDRGLNLSATDIIKSYLLEKISDNEGAMTALSREWDRIEDLCKKSNESISNLFNVYLHYLSEAKAQKALNDEFKKIISTTEKTSLEMVMEVLDLLKCIDEINTLTNDIDICMLRYLNQATYWKSVLAIAKYTNYQDYDGLKSLLVKYYYQSWIADGTANRVKQTSFGILKMVKDKESLSKIEELVKENLSKYNNYEQYLNGEFVYWKNWAKPILLLLEYLKEETVIFKELSRDLHIEHILPQEWKRDDLNWSEFFTENEAKKYLNSLGNLTLLKGSKNIQASNSNFSDKRDVYKGKYDSKANSFALTRDITDKYRKWNPKSIEKRQKEMIEEIINYLEF